ncbi:NAD(P)/FAD-dependent oxidoreductase [Laceyella putida]|uniref:NAD(P)/FAD-dependent oxidoreductase n=1 Tax=Laceyella putida TaxID=110101 RepID=A0ABW2RHP2_9BACL
MPKEVDVIIVGARCAGATLAMRLGQSGVRVCLVDAARFPSETLSTHAMFNNTVHHLKALGIGKLFAETSAPAVSEVIMRFDEVSIQGNLPIVQGESHGYCIRRSELDQALLEKAVSYPTVSFLEGFRVQSLLKRAGRVVGVRGRDGQGRVRDISARMVIGADGRHSVVRRELSLSPKQAVPSDFACYFSYLSHLEREGPPAFEVNRIGDYTLVVFPTSHQQSVVYVSFPNTDQPWMKAFQRHPMEAYERFLKENFQPISFHQRLARAVVEEPVRGLPFYDNVWYPAMGPGWVLVGDAAMFKDPALAQGIHDAVWGAELLAEVLIKYPDWQSQEAALAGEYEQRLDHHFGSLFKWALTMTKFHPLTAEQKRFFQWLEENDEGKERFIGLYNRAFKVEDYQAKVAEGWKRQMGEG